MLFVEEIGFHTQMMNHYYQQKLVVTIQPWFLKKNICFELNSLRDKKLFMQLKGSHSTHIARVSLNNIVL